LGALYVALVANTRKGKQKSCSTTKNFFLVHFTDFLDE